MARRRVKPLTDVRRAPIYYRSGSRIIGLLLKLGVPKKMLYVRSGSKGRNGSFWTRAVNHLAILEIARDNYRQRIRAIHPDSKADDAHENSVQLNSIWGQVEKMFRVRNLTLG